MNKKASLGMILLIVAAVLFLLLPAYMISDGAQVIFLSNIVPGIVMVALGLALLATGLRGRKVR